MCLLFLLFILHLLYAKWERGKKKRKENPIAKTTKAPSIDNWLIFAYILLILMLKNAFASSFLRALLAQNVSLNLFTIFLSLMSSVLYPGGSVAIINETKKQWKRNIRRLIFDMSQFSLFCVLCVQPWLLAHSTVPPLLFTPLYYFTFSSRSSTNLAFLNRVFVCLFVCFALFHFTLAFLYSSSPWFKQFLLLSLFLYLRLARPPVFIVMKSWIRLAFHCFLPFWAEFRIVKCKISVFISLFLFCFCSLFLIIFLLLVLSVCISVLARFVFSFLYGGWWCSFILH